MNIAVIGGGFTGLTAAYELTKRGASVTVFEKEPFLGGLAYGFKTPVWDWYIEGAYHHLFTNDDAILGLIRELNLGDSLIVKRPVTASLWRDAMYQLDSPMSLLTFPGLTMVDKFRTAMLLAILKITPFWQPLEGLTAEQLLISIGGKNAFRTIWEPLLIGKFGDYAPKIAASWFWARIKKRTPSLCYIRGGFHTLATALEQTIKQQGGEVITGVNIDTIADESRILNTESETKTKKSQFRIHNSVFDKVLLTIPTPLVKKILPAMPPSYTTALTTIPHLFAQTLILETDKPILKDVYWLNVTDRSFPFLAAVAHTNFMNPKHYGGHHLTYFGNYLPQGHPYLSMTKEQLLKKFMPYIKRLSQYSRFRIHDSFVFVGPFAQPVHELHYSRKIPPIATPLPGVYLSNMDFIVPWDRGTNYAVELGIRAAHALTQ